MRNAGVPDAPLVEAGWLREHMGEVIVLDCSVERIEGAQGETLFAPGHRLFERGHLPGARFADVMGAFSDPGARYPFTCPSRAGIESAARAMGLNNDSLVIAYDTLGGPYAARLWCVLTAFGFPNVRVLNGGLEAWKAVGGAIEAGASNAVRRGNFTAMRDPDMFVDAAYVMKMLEQSNAREPLICGLRTAQFLGEGSIDPRRGHIPTSLSMPYPDLLGAGGRVEAARVLQALGTLGLGKDIAPVLYCGGGINAAGLALALDLVGIKDVKIYDDSMNGWKDDPSLPVVHSDKGEAIAGD